MQFTFCHNLQQFFFHSVQTSPGARSASCPVQTGCCVLGLVAETFSWPLTSIYCRG